MRTIDFRGKAVGSGRWIHGDLVWNGRTPAIFEDANQENGCITVKESTLGMNTGHDGLLWLRTIRKKFPHIPVVLLTAYGEIGLAVKGMKEGAADFVTKPWDNNKLLGILREAVERSRKVAPLDEVTMDYVHKVVERCDGNISEAAKLLGITRQTLYAKIKRT